jgi:hypothetical protein
MDIPQTKMKKPLSITRKGAKWVTCSKADGNSGTPLARTDILADRLIIRCRLCCWKNLRQTSLMEGFSERNRTSWERALPILDSDCQFWPASSLVRSDFAGQFGTQGWMGRFLVRVAQKGYLQL